MKSTSVPTMANSTVPRRVLGQHLRSLRRQSGLTVKIAAATMEWSEPKMWRIETGQTAMRAMDVEGMCKVYGAPADLTCALAGLARQTKAHGWWHSYGEVIPEQFSIYATLEEAASELLGYASGQVPALLRTKAYARAAVMSNGPSTGDIDHLGRECPSPQSLVIRTNAPLSVTVVLSEAITRCPVGGAAVMAEQLRHLAELAALPNVCLHVLPFSLGMHPGHVTGPFAMLQFPPSGSAESRHGHRPRCRPDRRTVPGQARRDPSLPRSPRHVGRLLTGESATRDFLRAAAKQLQQ